MADTRDFRRSAGTLSAGVGAAGLLTYAYFSLASHELSADEYGEVVVLWASVLITVSVVHRPLEHFLSRNVAERAARGDGAGSVIRIAAVLQAGVALAFVLLALALRGPIEDDLLSGSSSLYWTYLAAGLSFGASFFARGLLAGSGRFRLLGGLLIAESLSRLLFALAVAIGIAAGQSTVALGVAAAPALSLIVVPLALVRRAAQARSSVDQEPAAGKRLARGGAFAAAVFVVMLSEQALLNGGPLILRGLEGAAAAGFIFNVLMLARAPLQVFQGVSISLLPHLTRARSRASSGRGEEFEASIGTTLRAVAAFTALVAVVVAAAGPTLMKAAFGGELEYDRTGLLIVTVAMGFYLGATTLNQAALAQGQARRAAVTWAACAAGFLIWSALPILEPERRVELGFALAALALFAALLRLYRDPRARAEDVPGPGSPAELDAELALADEAG